MSLFQKGLSCGFHIHHVSLISAAVCSSHHTLARNSYSYPLQAAGLVTRGKRGREVKPVSAAVPGPAPLDLTEENVRRVLVDARGELGQIFDTSVGITGTVELAELDGPFLKIRLKGRFWHMRSTVVARVANYLKQRIPEILEVDIEDEKQLDDSPDNF